MESIKNFPLISHSSYKIHPMSLYVKSLDGTWLHIIHNG